MAETVRIDIPIESTDNTDPAVSNVNRKLEKMDEMAKKATSSTKKATESVSKFDRAQEKTERSLKSWTKEKYQVLMEAKDKVSPVLSAIKGGMKSIFGKGWSLTMKAADFATAPIRGVINLLRNPILQAGAILGISIGMKDTIDTYKNFEQTMSGVQAVSGASASQLARLTEKAKEMGATTKFTAAQAGEAFNYMAMAGWKTEDMLNGIDGILNLAAASGADLGTTSDIVTDALTAFKLTAADAAHFSDVLAQASSNANTNVTMMGETFKYAGAMAGTLGYSIEDVGLAVGLMANSGIKASQAGTQLNSIFTRLSTDTNGARKAIEELGIKFFDDKGNARAFKDVIDELRVATKGYTDEQKTNLANTIAGTRAQAGLLAMLNASEADYNKLAESINNADGAAQRMSDTMLDNLSGSLTLLQSATDGVKISFGERLAPYVRGVADWLTAYMPNIEKGLDELMDWVDIKIDKAKAKFKEISGTEEWQGANFFGKAGILLDEYILDPLSDWWNGTGKAKVASFAGDIGKGIGTGLKVGLLTLLGIDVSDTVNEATSIGAQFSKGFSEGFDFGLIADKFGEGLKNLFSNAAKLLPGGESADLSSLMSLMLLNKIMTPAFALGKGGIKLGKALFGGREALGGMSAVGSILGSTGNAMVGGTGILGGLANIGYGLTNTSKAGMYFGSMAGQMSGGMAALTGAGALAGGVVGGATLISGAVDAYKAIKSDSKDEKKAYGTSAGLKVGGVAAGAAIGTAILPGVGTLIGAGIGGLAGWIAGDKVKKNYEEEVEEAKKQAEIARKCFETTGLAVDQVKFKNSALNDALKDSEVSAQEFANMLQEQVAETMSNAFGKVHLSLTEIKDMAQKITFGNAIDSVTEFANATTTAKNTYASLQSSVSELRKENWKVSLGLTLTETDQDNYKKAIENFVENATSYIEDNHYQATVALSLLTDGTGDTTNLDTMYNGMKDQIKTISDKLSSEMEIALSDGVITLDESKELTNLQDQITEITNKLNSAQEEAQLDALKIKYTNGAQLDSASFQQLQQELQTQVQGLEDNYNEALVVSLTNLKLQLSEGAIDQTEYDKQVQELTADYTAHINDMNVRVESFNLDTIATAWSSELEGILPDIQGTTAEKLQEAMNQALLINPTPAEWTPEQIKEWFGLESLAAANGEAFTAIQEQLKTTAMAIPETTKNDMKEQFKNSLPTADELMASIDWDNMTYDMRDQMLFKLNLGPENVQYLVNSGSDWSSSDLMKNDEQFEALKQQLVQQIESAFNADDIDVSAIQSFIDEYHLQVETAASSMDFSDIMAQYGPISNEYYAELQSQWAAAGTDFANAMNTDASATLLSGSSQLRTSANTAITNAFANPFNVTANINVTGQYNLLNPFSAPNLPVASGHKASGGMVSGKQLSWVGEEGAEAIIPLIPSRRSRAIDLYEQVGEILGVGAHADGGIVGGSNSGLDIADGNLFTNALKNGAQGYMDSTEVSGEVASGDQTVSADTVARNMGGTTVQLSVQMSPNFEINGDGGVDENSIMAIIRKNMKSMADELGGEIAEKLETVFSNMPVKTREA